MTDLDCVVHGAAELVTAAGDGAGAPAGGGTGDSDGPSRADAVGLGRHADAALAVVDGRVAAVGDSEAVAREYPPENAATAVDAAGGTVLPGFVDAHTHALFAGDRSDEFAAKLRGRSYRDILAEGGGILRTVRAVRDASDEQLVANLLAHLDVMLAHGTTTVEVKSGYGLDAGTELRMLEAVARADEAHPVDVVPTFMGAHAVPEGRDADDYVDEVVDEQLPAVADRGVAAFCDVFCEEGVFSVEQSRRVLEAGLDHGLAPKVHAEEFVRLGGARLAAEVGAASADHLLYATDEDVAALVEAGVTPVLLPATAFALGEGYADARAFLDAGAPVALATDFNPNCYSRSVQFAVTLGCVGMGMTPAESVVAATRNGARALGAPTDEAGQPVGATGPVADGTGTLAEGAPGDAVVVDAPSHVHVPYALDTNLVDAVVKGGERVV